MKRLFFTVTNDLNYDQRMIRICNTLAGAGYKVTLVGRKMPGSAPLSSQPFHQKRLRCFFHRGKKFYAEYNVRLFLYLLSKRIDCICAIDLDTILPCYYISRLKRIKRVYDAHELFCEMKEVVTRPSVYKKWKRIEKMTVPKFQFGYTVNEPIAAEFKKMYDRDYTVIRNLPLLKPLEIPAKKDKYIFYQGAINEGRSFETLIPAMTFVDATLLIAGDGNFRDQAGELVLKNNLGSKVKFLGKILPAALVEYTRQAWIGVTLFENRGLSNYYSLANRFFDYFHAGIPQLCVNYPAYREVNKIYKIAVLIDNLDPVHIAEALNELLQNRELYDRLQANCMKARQELNWQEEERKLLAFYHAVANT